ncbi:MAG TPA: hypothetical protein VHD84_03485 [Candidatus Saccharimonadales bacterium]|nr:hypothetical protein [Candidatus Saccharimonadales bacterium]
MASPESPNSLLLSEDEQLSLATKLLDEGIFGIHQDPDQVIILKNGRESPHYLDVRKGISVPDLRRKLVTDLASLATRQAWQRERKAAIGVYDHIAGTPEAMTSYAALIADSLKMSLLQPRVDTAKKTGNKTPILGQFWSGEAVAEFDDVVTDGQSKIDTIRVLTDAGLEVKDYFVVLDREEGGAKHVREATGMSITPALGVSSMVRILRADARINKAQFDNVARYLDKYGEDHAKETINTA